MNEEMNEEVNKKAKYLCTKCAFQVIGYKENMKKYWNICFIFGGILSYLISYSKNTIPIVLYVSEMFNAISLAFLAMIVGAYAIFQALLNDDLVYEMYNYKNDDGKGNLLEETNKEFLGLLILYLASILMNIIVLILFKITPKYFVLFDNNYSNISLCTFFLLLYISFHLRIYIEIRNFAINLYRIFEAHNILSIIKKEKSKKDEEQDE